MKLYLFISCFFIFILFAIADCDKISESNKVSESDKAEFRLIYRMIKKLGDRHELRYAGRSVSFDKGVYKKLGLDFQICKILSKDEGRKMLIECSQEFLKEIHTDPAMQDYIHSEFSASNIELIICVAQSNGEVVFYPKIRIFALSGDKIQYLTKSPDQEYGFFTREEETFEEALRIVEAQKTENGRMIDH